MVNGYISKADVLNLPQSIERNLRGEIVERSIDVKDIEALKPADVVPVVHGKWIGYDDTERFTAQCGLCGNVIDTRFGSNFCPNCGAKMDA